MHELEDIKTIKGVGDKKAALFNKLGVYLVRDMLLFYPRTYITYPEPVSVSQSVCDRMCAVSVRVRTRPVTKNVRMAVTITSFRDEMTGEVLEAVWFRSPYIASKLRIGEQLVLYGKLVMKNNKKTIAMPQVFSIPEYSRITGRMRPVYSLTAGLSNNALTGAIEYALQNVTYEEDVIPADITEKFGLVSHGKAILGIHFPKDFDDLKKSRDRLVFEEFYTFLSKLKAMRESEKKLHNIFAFEDTAFVKELSDKLPYTLTNAQKNALNDILADLNSPYISTRMIQGDVGSGKTIVALLSMLYVTESGYQAIIMAPTSVLAAQHYESFVSIIKGLGIEREVVLLTGKSKNKAALRKKIAEEPGLIIVGTHALISESVEYYAPALVITDEQHRFGVKQRDALKTKNNECPHEIAMSATPIPRSLAMILYAGVPVSVIDELPAMRLPIKSFVANESYRKSVYRHIEKELNDHRQVYVICPLVEPTEGSDLTDVESESEHIREIFPDARIESLNGRMNADKKDEIMESFSRGDTDILVSTTVIEVGINVPNATFMLIEDAQVFGLATLHQLRGRVGRGSAQSYCIFMNSSDKPEAYERLKIMGESDNGFEIADHDLSSRGPGDFFGIRQSGEMGFVLADIYQDAALLRKAAESLKEN